ncbi:MAG: SDR family NAD(P)-dependent oxidoreductase [Anaerolineae bacterium]|nr:SDR family NAD(P)-dependent oxidoreductase [Anaerolineae bacterium]
MTDLIDDLPENHDIAIIGMSCRFPGAPDIETFWQNLREGVESITFFSDDELKELGVPDAHLNAPNFVKASPVLENIDQFDASFFGYAPREAELLDPQHRLFLEQSWLALENAGYAPQIFPGLIGVFAGTSLSTYLLFNILTNPTLSDGEHSFEVMIGNDKDFLSTRVSYHFDLRGPSLDVQTGCSTSLVATHLACEALLSFQCDIALVGGVSVNVPQRTGYFYQEGGINSADGHCRTFDAQATGTLFGSGVGVVVLKRLEEAIADNDTVYAVIKSTAVNNDGSQKVGYTAPGIEGQTEVITRALTLADINPKTIGYVETHGTGTPLGDPVEMTALTKAYRALTEAKQFCAVGSVKSNIGHLDAAAGVASLIKTALSLYHQQIVPSLHFNEANPTIDFANSPFFVSDQLLPWPQYGAPRRAGVSSFGIGGTNAHVILEEAPIPPEPQTKASASWQLVLLSARSSPALETLTSQLANHLEMSADSLADIAFTLQNGRKRFPLRRAFICQNKAEALITLRTLPPGNVQTAYEERQERPVVFMFPGGGAQYVNMGRDLYGQEPIFREVVDQCATILLPLIGFDLRRKLFGDGDSEQAQEEMKETALALPALFTISYAMSRLLLAWGVQPQAMIGHSMGEYVAACLAGVFSLEEALAVVAKRGHLFAQLPPGAMISIPLGAEQVRPLLAPHLSFAAINAPDQCVVSGPVAAVEAFAAALTERQIEYRRLQINVAAHSHMIDLIEQPFTQFISTLKLQPPQRPFISNVSGNWITNEEATSAAYWGRQLRQTVLFHDGITLLLAEPGYVFLEVGPGRSLSTLAQLQADRERRQSILPTMRHPHDQVDDTAFLQDRLGQLWIAGVALDWSGFHAKQTRRRLPLPTYPFERQRYWIEPGKLSDRAWPMQKGKSLNIADWFYVPTWQQTPARPPLRFGQFAAEPRTWLIFDEGDVGTELTAQLQMQNQVVVRVLPGARFSDGRVITIRPGVRADYDTLLRQLQQKEQLPDEIIHLWNKGVGDTDFAAAQEKGFYSLLHLAQAWETLDIRKPVKLWVLASGLFSIESQDVVLPERATLLSPCKIVPQELEQVTCYVVDALPQASTDSLVQQLLAEIAVPTNERVLAFRGRHRWQQQFTPLPLTDSDETPWPLRQKGIYVILGGLGNIGLLLADYLAKEVQARLVLVSRSPLPARASWEQYLATSEPDDRITAKIRKVQAVEAAGGEVMLVQANVADKAALQAAISDIEAHFGEINGIIHAAGLAGQKTIKLLSQVDKPSCADHFQAKVQGTVSLQEVLQNKPLDFVILFSSNVSILGGLGATSYAAANLFMDAFCAVQHGSQRWISANWDGWLTEKSSSLSQGFQTSIDQYAMQPEESVVAFRRVVTNVPAGQIVVSTGSLEGRLKLWINQTGRADQSEGGERHPRPTLSTTYAPPENEIEALVIDVWQQLLGIDQLGVHDNFFDLGGNSLIALKVISHLKQTLQIDIPVVSLFEGPTAHALAEMLNQQQNGQPPLYEASQSRGERRRLRHQQRFTGDA